MSSARSISGFRSAYSAFGSSSALGIFVVGYFSSSSSSSSSNFSSSSSMFLSSLISILPSFYLNLTELKSL